MLLCLGPLTNIAVILQTDADFGKRLKHCYVMGGNYHGELAETISHPSQAGAIIEMEHYRRIRRLQHIIAQQILLIFGSELRRDRRA